MMDKILYEKLKSEGKDINHNSILNILDIDVNETLSTTHLGLDLLESIDNSTGGDLHLKEIASDLIENGVSRKHMIEQVLKELKGFSYEKFENLATYSGKYSSVRPDMKDFLKRLYPTKLYAWSTSPIEVVRPFIAHQVKRFYTGPIIITATQVDVEDGVLTGKALSVIDSDARIELQKRRDQNETDYLKGAEKSLSSHSYKAVKLWE